MAAEETFEAWVAGTGDRAGTMCVAARKRLSRIPRIPMQRITSTTGVKDRRYRYRKLIASGRAEKMIGESRATLLPVDPPILSGTGISCLHPSIS
jgi:hypothetical protein